MKFSLILATLTSLLILSGCAPDKPIPVDKNLQQLPCEKVVKKLSNAECVKKTKVVYYEDLCGDNSTFPVTVREVSINCNNGEME